MLPSSVLFLAGTYNIPVFTKQKTKVNKIFNSFHSKKGLHLGSFPDFQNCRQLIQDL